MKLFSRLGKPISGAIGAMLLCVLVAPANAATDTEINQVIQDGLAWLSGQQNPSAGYFGSGPWLANTAAAVLAFENEGHFPGGGTEYSDEVEKGLNYLFTGCYTQSIGPQIHGDPDTNGNGLGIFFSHYSRTYETGMVMQAIVASNTPDRLVTTSGACYGMTYYDVMVDVVDWLAWGQGDAGTGRGGWNYNPNYSYGDNSVSQWPVLGLIAAEQWGISAPAFVKSELNYWIDYIQDDASGGSGYSHPTYMVNISKTGGLLVEMYYAGDSKDTPRAQKALNYINSRWNISPYGTWYGNRGNPYAMFAVFKGLELMQVPTIPSAPANLDTSPGDWWGDYAEFLVNTQYVAGYWDGYGSWGPFLATPWYTVILQASVFPISVDVEVPEGACDDNGYDVSVTYSVERFPATGTLSVFEDDVLFNTVNLVDFQGSETLNYNLPSDDTGMHTWRAVLNVTGGGIAAQAEDSDAANVYDTPQVIGIPDQVIPFESFDLDDFQTCPGDYDVDWSASGMPTGWSVDIDTEHVATIIAPEGVTEPASITFEAVFHWPEVDCFGSDAAIFAPNQPPVAHTGMIYPDEWYEVNEGGSVLIDGSESHDPDGDVITMAWDLDEDGDFESPGAVVAFSASGLDGPDHMYIHLQVCDEHDACSYGRARVDILNVAPVVGAITAPGDPVPIGTEIAASADFTDAGIPDTHTATWNWGYDSSAGTVNQGAGGGSVLDHHTYNEPGVYIIELTVTDDDGASDSTIFQYVVVYDPDGSFVTGGGTIYSPAGAYLGDPTLTGMANFGFVSKYKKGASVPIGHTEFQFHAAGLDFKSSDYEWLVVAGARAQFKGTGTITGLAGSFKFFLTAIDGEVNGGGGSDKFRIKIWDAADENIMIYDNQLDAELDADPTTVIQSGSIVIHSKNKK
jgi:hypothetical protein